jgi:hypothetical protein
MILSFTDFINETVKPEDFISDLSLKLIQKIKSFTQEEKEYTVFAGMEFKNPFEFDLRLIVRKDRNPDIATDSHFSELPWEEINFKNKGYAIDANVRMHKDSLLIPEISLYLIIDPDKEPQLYGNLYARLVDILVHETNHIDQIALNRNPFNVTPEPKENRNAAKKSHQYFLLIDEVESMVEGMLARSKVLDKPLDYIFDDYLIPFVQSKYITKEEYEEVIKTWVKFALEKHPDANFSKKVEKIVNSI